MGKQFAEAIAAAVIAAFLGALIATAAINYVLAFRRM
jgi:hypothetical protein